MNSAAKVLLLAIDAGDKLLIQNWSRDGTMPVLNSLLARGLVGDTMSVEGFYEGSTWPCFYTGVNPARHGFHRLTQITPGTYDFHHCSPGEFIAREPFWNHLSRAGKKVAILDIPLTGIAKRLNGIHMVEWGSHDAAHGFHTWPAHLKKEVLRRFGTHPMTMECDAWGRSAHDFRRLRDKLIEGVQKKTELTLHYLNQCEWDFFAQVFTEGHCAGHQCWHLHDPAHPNYDRQVVSIAGDPMREVYRAIDCAIGRILERVDERTIVFVLATHRMAHNIGASFLLEDILERMKYLSKAAPCSGSPAHNKIRHLVSFVKKELKKLPASAQTTLEPGLSYPYRMLKRFISGHDCAYTISARVNVNQSRCFPHENGNLISGIRINLVGREPNGVVMPGAEMEELCRLISADLMALVDADSGKSAVYRVHRVADLFQGEYMDHLPDLLVEWNEDIVIGSKALNPPASYRLRVGSNQIGTIEGEYTYCRTGDHRPQGLVIVAGPGIPPGVMQREISLMDFAPTFLNLFRLAAPNLDGKPIDEVS
jgi:predicted AlkP superfamily phosphohydrolase/phosphomutase